MNLSNESCLDNPEHTTPPNWWEESAVVPLNEMNAFVSKIEGYNPLSLPSTDVPIPGMCVLDGWDIFIEYFSADGRANSFTYGQPDNWDSNRGLGLRKLLDHRLNKHWDHHEIRSRQYYIARKVFALASKYLKDKRSKKELRINRSYGGGSIFSFFI
jgi:hypothetical protein